MGEQVGSKVQLLASIARVDNGLAQIAADRRRLEVQLADVEQGLKKRRLEIQARERVLAERRVGYQQEEGSIKDEEQKLVSRRKALGTLSNRKSIEKAEQEIGFAGRQIDKRQEVLLASLDEIERVEKERAVLEGEANALAQQLETLREEARATFINLEQRENDYRLKRTDLCALIDPESLALYERVRSKYPGDAVTVVNGASCSSCCIQVAAQLLVEIQRGGALVRCRGCGRILCMAEGEASSSE